MSEDIISCLATYICTDILRQPQRLLYPSETLITSGLIDSFHLVDIAMFIEETYAIQISEDEINIANFDTLEKIAALIQSHRN
ncbi:MAG: acyl carrier protein [Anaerolineae bacterium]|nr:acyl carrier protein [Anaerolineae bacterium]